MHRHTHCLSESQVSEDRSSGYPRSCRNSPARATRKPLQNVSELLKEESKPLLQPPKILRVLLLPYKGDDEELFMSRYVYLKIEDSQWVLTDLKEQ